MNYPPDPSEQIILKTAQAALRGYAAACTSRFQSPQAVPAASVTTSNPLRSSARTTDLNAFCVPRATPTVSHTRAVTASSGTTTPVDNVREMIRLTSRPHQNLSKPPRHGRSTSDKSAYSRRIARPETYVLPQGQLTGCSTTRDCSRRGKSVSTVTAEEYCIRRVPRQRVFHEKGNAD